MNMSNQPARYALNPAGHAGCDLWQERLARGEDALEALNSLVVELGFSREEIGALAFFAGLVVKGRRHG